MAFPQSIFHNTAHIVDSDVLAVLDDLKGILAGGKPLERCDDERYQYFMQVNGNLLFQVGLYSEDLFRIVADISHWRTMASFEVQPYGECVCFGNSLYPDKVSR
jgi:hypothetical protein